MTTMINENKTILILIYDVVIVLVYLPSGSDTLTTAADDYVLHSVDSCKAIKVEISPFHKISAEHINKAVASQESLDENVRIDFECKDVKLQPTSLCDYENCQPIVKIEYEEQTNDITENIFIYFECKSVKLEQTSHPTIICKAEDKSCQPNVKKENPNPKNYVNNKKLVILIKKGFIYDNNCRFNMSSRFKRSQYLKMRNFDETAEKRASNKSKVCQKTESSLKNMSIQNLKVLSRIKTNPLNVTFVINYLDRKLASNLT
uniref:Uncharacterized protein n=1 Tax=Trichogramma kaykai TaxID=54128 RepID=A0ABD2X9V6_9HYME